MNPTPFRIGEIGCVGFKRDRGQHLTLFKRLKRQSTSGIIGDERCGTGVVSIMQWPRGKLNEPTVLRLGDISDPLIGTEAHVRGRLAQHIDFRQVLARG